MASASAATAQAVFTVYVAYSADITPGASFTALTVPASSPRVRVHEVLAVLSDWLKQQYNADLRFKQVQLHRAVMMGTGADAEPVSPPTSSGPSLAAHASAFVEGADAAFFIVTVTPISLCSRAGGTRARARARTACARAC